MADLTQTRANVRLISGFPQTLPAGEAILQGEPVRDVGGSVFKSRNNTLENSRFVGVALTPQSVVGQPVVIAPPGSVVDVGASLTVADVYIVSSNAGAIAPIADLGSTHFLSVILVGLTATTGRVLNVVTGVQKP